MSDTNTELGHGHVSLAVSVIAGIFAWIDGHTLSEFIKGIAGVISAGAGIMAIRYYYFATKKAQK